MRVAIVNDLRLAVEALKQTLAQAPGCEVAWTAVDGAQAVAKCVADRPDLILMDIVMPIMDGVEATRRIMKEAPCPILVVTSTVEGNLERVYNALGAGALDAVQGPSFKPDGTLDGVQRVVKRIRALQRIAASASSAGTPASAASGASGASAVNGQPTLPVLLPRPGTGRAAQGQAPVLALGASTGGPEALRAVLKGFSSSFQPAVVIVLHLDPEFVPGFCEWLGAQVGRRVRPALQGDVPEAGSVLVAAGKDHLALAPDGALLYTPDPVDHPYRPSVDVFFASLARNAARPGAAALLTGMGRDGGQGLLALRKAGWRTFAQDEATSVVYGMPRAARDLGAAHEILPLPALGTALEAAYTRQLNTPRPVPESR
ncbi:MAG: chemotaxis-specific protein-glutamate methyltransferase CheB [Planctomycetia bacterium]